MRVIEEKDDRGVRLVPMAGADIAGFCRLAVSWCVARGVRYVRACHNETEFLVYADPAEAAANLWHELRWAGK